VGTNEPAATLVHHGPASIKPYPLVPYEIAAPGFLTLCSVLWHLCAAGRRAQPDSSPDAWGCSYALVMGKKRESINEAFRVAAETLGAESHPQIDRRRPGSLLKDGSPSAPGTNPSLDGSIDGTLFRVVNHGEDEEGGKHYYATCIVTILDPVLPPTVSVDAKLAGPYGDSWNPLVTALERFAATLGGAFVRPRPRNSVRRFFGSRWVQLDEPDEKGFVVAAKFKWPGDATPPPYGTPDAVMTTDRIVALRSLLELHSGMGWALVLLDNRGLKFQTAELQEADSLVELTQAALKLASTFTTP
jgi:hypothetical protein